MNEVNTFYKCDVKVETEDDKGRVKNRKEEYIVEATGPTEVEKKITKELEGLDFEIDNIKMTKIIKIIK